MGFDIHAIRFFFRARALGASFQRTATLGRQGLNLDAASMARVLAAVGSPLSAEEISRVFEGHEGFADGVLHHLGAAQVDSFDASSYERATHTHDFNQPIPNVFMSAIHS